MITLTLPLGHRQAFHTPAPSSDLQLGKVSCQGGAAQCCRDGGLSGREPEEFGCRVNGVIRWGFSRKRAPTVINLWGCSCFSCAQHHP